MLRVPDLDEVLSMGRELGFDFTRMEAEVVQMSMAGSIKSLERFDDMNLEEERLPLRHFNRDPGGRPSPEEDPLNAFLRKCYVEGAAEGLLKGKTVALKDHVAVANVPQNFGSHFMDGYTPDFDATIVTRMLDQGAVIIGKLNLDDFSNGGPSYGDGGNYNRVLNPHNPKHVAGTSSSGSGAAVAGGYVDIAIGGDQGGSIRCPSAWSGVVGIKATFGMIPHTGVFGSDPSIDFVGPMARTVEDVAAALECMAGVDGYDPRQINVPSVPAYTKLLHNGVKGLRIGILQEGFTFAGTDQDVVSTVEAAIEQLSQAGAIISKVSLPIHQAQTATLAQNAIRSGLKYLYDTNYAGAFAKTYYPSSMITTFGRFKDSHAYELPIRMKTGIMTSSYVNKRYHGRFYAKAMNARKGIIAAYNRAFEECDILVMPTVPTCAPLYHKPEDDKTALQQTMLNAFSSSDPEVIRGRNTSCFNYTGHPAISVPCGKKEGLPIGLQLVGKFFDEATLLQAAFAVQAAVKYEHLPLPERSKFM